MNISDFIHHLAWKFFDSLWIRVNQICLRNKTFSLFANDCIGGVICHSCGLQFKSPTVNLYFADLGEYVTFLEHLPEYKNSPIIEDPSQGMDYPVGIIKNAEFGDVCVHFMHYKTFDEAVSIWKRRFERIDYENLFAILHVSKLPEKYEELFQRFSKLPYKGKCLISWPHVLPDGFSWNDSLFIHPDNLIYEHGKLLHWKNHFRKRYIDDFDYVSFLNGKTVIKRARK